MEKILLYCLAIISAGILTTGCGNNTTAPNAPVKDSSATFDLAAIKKIIAEKNNKFTQAHIKGDTAYLNNIFTKDAKVFAPGADVVIGRPAIAALNVEYVQSGIKQFDEVTTGLYGNNDYVFDEGTYYFRYGKENTIEKGKYLNVWKKENGDWKIFTNMWNTNAPAAPAK
jgi:hypothetical protein